MILKVRQPSGEWFFYDNIQRAKVYFGEMPNQPYDPENFVKLLPEVLTPGDCIVDVDLVFKDAPTKEIVFVSGEGYLMNDEGKTIEKL